LATAANAEAEGAEGEGHGGGAKEDRRRIGGRWSGVGRRGFRRRRDDLCLGELDLERWRWRVIGTVQNSLRRP